MHILLTGGEQLRTGLVPGEYSPVVVSKAGAVPSTTGQGTVGTTGEATGDTTGDGLIVNGVSTGLVGLRMGDSNSATGPLPWVVGEDPGDSCEGEAAGEVVGAAPGEAAGEVVGAAPGEAAGTGDEGDAPGEDDDEAGDVGVAAGTASGEAAGEADEGDVVGEGEGEADPDVKGARLAATGEASGDSTEGTTGANPSVTGDVRVGATVVTVWETGDVTGAST